MRNATMLVLALAVIAIGVGVCPPPARSWQDNPAADDVKGTGDPERGGKLYSRYCRGCHGEAGKGDGLVFMPHVNNLTRKGYIEHLPDSYLLLAIAKGGPGIGKSSYMPAWEGTLSSAQMLDIIAYIRSLPLN